MIKNFKVLSNGVNMPSIGFGTYKSGSDEETAKIVKYALEAGYRQIDTASFYGNEVGIGNGIKESGIKREDLFLVTKLQIIMHPRDLEETWWQVIKKILNLQERK